MSLLVTASCCACGGGAGVAADDDRLDASTDVSEVDAGSRADTTPVADAYGDGADTRAADVADTGGAGDAEDTGGRAPLVMGLYNNTAIPPAKEGNTTKNFRAVVDKYFVVSRLRVHRVFDSKLPSSYATSAGADDPADGVVSFLSVKPATIAGVAAGTYDDAIRALAKSMPSGTYLTMFHEPENDMDGATFVAMFRHFYSVAKAANGALSIGYVAMAYQWRPGSASTTTPDDWWPGAASTDWLGVDAYVAGWEKTAYSLDVDPQFQRWYSWARTKGKPLILPEYGVEAESTGGFRDEVRADAITKSLAWVWTQPNIKMVLWWNGTSSTPGGKDHTLDPTTSQPADLSPLARAAWNDAVTRYGSTGATF